MAISTESLLPLTILRVRLHGGCSIRVGDEPAEDKLKVGLRAAKKKRKR